MKSNKQLESQRHGRNIRYTNENESSFKELISSIRKILRSQRKLRKYKNGLITEKKALMNL